MPLGLNPFLNPVITSRQLAAGMSRTATADTVPPDQPGSKWGYYHVQPGATVPAASVPSLIAPLVNAPDTVMPLQWAQPGAGSVVSTINPWGKSWLTSDVLKSLLVQQRGPVYPGGAPPANAKIPPGGVGAVTGGPAGGGPVVNVRGAGGGGVDPTATTSLTDLFKNISFPKLQQIDPSILGGPATLGPLPKMPLPKGYTPAQVTLGNLPQIDVKALTKQVLAAQNIDYKGLSKTAQKQAEQEVGAQVKGWMRLQEQYRALGRRQMLDINANAAATADMLNPLIGSPGHPGVMSQATTDAVRALGDIGAGVTAGQVATANQNAAGLTPVASGVNLAPAGQALATIGAAIPASGIAAQGLALQGELAQEPGLIRAGGTQAGLMAQAAQNAIAQGLNTNIQNAYGQLPTIARENLNQLVGIAQDRAKMRTDTLFQLAQLSGLSPADVAKLREQVGEFNVGQANQANQFNIGQWNQAQSDFWTAAVNRQQFNAGQVADWRTALAGIAQYNVGQANAAAIAKYNAQVKIASTVLKGTNLQLKVLKDGSMWAFDPSSGAVKQVRGPAQTTAPGLKQTDISNLGKRIAGMAGGKQRWVPGVPGAAGLAGSGHYIPDQTVPAASFQTAVNTVMQEVPSWSQQQAIDFVTGHSDKYMKDYVSQWRAAHGMASGSYSAGPGPYDPASSYVIGASGYGLP